MEIYQYIVENESVTHFHYFSYEAAVKNIMPMLLGEFKEEMEVVDIFPEPKIEKVTTINPLLVHTKSGQEMYLPRDFDVTIIGHSRILVQSPLPL